VCCSRAVRTCLDKRDPEAEGCLRGHFRLVADHAPVTRCNVGLQLRSLALDDPRCNLLERFHVDRHAANGNSANALAASAACHTLARSRSSKVSFRCGRPRDRFPRGVEACPGAPFRFATTDQPALYNATRARGWRDLAERPVNPFIQTNESARAAQPTVAAWAMLARCSHGIISPLPSAFALSASMAAGVPLVGCCSHLRACLRVADKWRSGCYNMGTRRKFQP
jgi:hypothetical protein